MRFTRAAVSAALLFSCVRSAPSSGSAYGAWGVDLTTRIRSVRPGDDFFGHANGGWLNTFEIPDDATSYGIVDSIRHRVERRLLAVLQEPTGEWSPTVAKLRDAFAAAVDTEQRDRLGLEPIEVSLNAIASATSWDGLNPALAELHPSGPFEIGIIADPIDPGRYIAFVVQSGPRGGTGRDASARRVCSGIAIGPCPLERRGFARRRSDLQPDVARRALRPSAAL